MDSADVVQTWARLETWARENLPGLLAELKAPAQASAIARLEATLGAALPSDFRASLGVHDGESGDGELLDSGGLLLDVRAIGEDLERERQALRRYADLFAERLSGPARRVLYAARRVPIIDFNRDLTWLLDLDPAPGGDVGQVLRRDVEAGVLEVVAPSFGAFLGDYLNRLETGRAQFTRERLTALQAPPRERSAFKARLQRFARALKAQRPLDLREAPDGVEVDVLGSVGPPTPGMGNAEYRFATGESIIILTGELGLSAQDIAECNMRGEVLMFRVRGIIRRRLSRHGREQVTLEMQGFEAFD